MRVTVGICTWNRASLLDQTLTRMHSLQVPRGAEWELLVVNNNCTDDTDQVLEKHSPKLPLRRLFEPRQGLSHSRNCLMDAAETDLVLWTDDDVLVDAHWLSAYVEAAKEWPEVTFFGGPVDPWFASQPPRWIGTNLDLIGGAFALLDHGSETRPLEPRMTPYGANMGMRLAAVRGFHFDPRLGRKGTDMLSEEETDFFRRLVGAGHSGLWVGSARVRHYIPADRLYKRYVSRFFEGVGRTDAMLREVEGKRRILGVPIYLIRYYLNRELKTLILSPFRSRKWVRALKSSSMARGKIRELLARRKHDGVSSLEADPRPSVGLIPDDVIADTHCRETTW